MIIYIVVLSLYSQNYILDTFLIGVHKAVGVTKGILTIDDKILLIGGKIIKPAKFWDTTKRTIKTKKIKILQTQEEVICDVILLNPNDLGYMEKALLLSQKYNEVKVYNISEVITK